MRGPVASDYKATCGRSGKNVADLKLPLLRQWPSRHARPRKLTVRVWSYVGVSPGAKHVYAELSEERNPLWDWEDECWRDCWDDKSEEAVGRSVKAEFVGKDADRKARRWARETAAKLFPKHAVVGHGGVRPRWFRTAQRVGD